MANRDGNGQRLCRALLSSSFWLCALCLSASAEEATKKNDLGDILLRKGIITAEELRQARDEEQQKEAANESRLDMLRAKLPQWLDMLTPFGDVRLRDEGFYQNELHARNRFRLRARIGLTANVSSEVRTTVRLTTGNADDPISNNQTLDSTFTSKSINLNWAYLTLEPGKSFHVAPGWLTVTAGKFGVNTYRPSELVWDEDVAPEGATETFNFVESRTGFLRGLRVNALQWVVDEVSNGSDPWIPGGQVVSEAALSATTLWTLALADYYYDHFNAVARRSLNQFKDPPANTKPNSTFNDQLANSNSVVKDTNGKILGYRSGFNVLNASTELNAVDATGLGIPAGVFGDLACNTLADGHNLGIYVGAGMGNAGKDWYRDTLKNQGDWGFSYTYAWVEKDAVASIFTFSDINEFSTRAATAGSRPTQKGATNLTAHIVRLDYQLLPGLQLTAKVHLINALDRKISNAALTGNPTLMRTQLDAILRF